MRFMVQFPCVVDRTTKIRRKPRCVKEKLSACRKHMICPVFVADDMSGF
jgi:hypothetical protein